MERLIVAPLMTHVNDNYFLSKDQFGFRKFFSTANQLLITYNEVTDFLDRGKFDDLILFYFAKAFDTVCHRVLLFMQGRRLGVLVGGANAPDKKFFAPPPKDCLGRGQNKLKNSVFHR